nr:DUF4167 domain-containing protein [Paracoccus tegillarcae]
MGNVVNRVFDSSGPEGKVRGTPQQIIDKYLTLARDAQLSNDRVAEQSFLQHAEHYTRMLGEALREQAERQAQHQQNNNNNNNNNNPHQNQRNSGDEDGRGGNGGPQQQDPQSQNAEPNQSEDRHQQRAPRDEQNASQGGLPDAVASEDEKDSGLVETPEAQAKPKPKRTRAPRGEGAATRTPAAPRSRRKPAAKDGDNAVGSAPEAAPGE